jgi:hypothetical protein
MVDLLSTQISVVMSYGTFTSCNNLLIQIAWITPSDAATYAASQVDNMMMDYFFDNHVKVVSRKKYISRGVLIPVTIHITYKFKQYLSL